MKNAKANKFIITLTGQMVGGGGHGPLGPPYSYTYDYDTRRPALIN